MAGGRGRVCFFLSQPEESSESLVGWKGEEGSQQPEKLNLRELDPRSLKDLVLGTGAE